MNENNHVIKLSNGKIYHYKVLDSKTIELFTKNVSVKEISKNRGVIQSLILDDSIEIIVGKCKIEVGLTSTPNFYEINYITKLGTDKYLLTTHLVNRTSTYILPCFNTSKENLYYDSYFINSYIEDSKEPKFVYLLYRYFNDVSFNMLEKTIKDNKNFVNSIDLTPEYVAYKFLIPINFREDVNIFLEGQYSKLSLELKKLIIRFHKVSKSSNLHGILYKTDEYKKLLEKEFDMKIDVLSELDSKPNREFEIFKL
jgi:hypothetical protein